MKEQIDAPTLIPTQTNSAVGELEQIEEIAKVICEDCAGSATSCITPMCDAVYSNAQALYNAGYRKQSEGEWEQSGLSNPKCSLCRSYNYEKSNFCPNCGAKMKGGAEGRNNEADIPTNSFKWDERVHNRGGWDGFCDGY